ncbi:dipeptidyl-peptidase III, putative [Leishmania tarentolae]|uniref:Dipeptidyl-peptidase III, putative n=1 Tax=Leishmania tarentolae TaxID=5689 RepID=A0A640K8D6_LEITA|nr:dipeptidyl-peptidase III, putative [Leishmania tarentolae]
MRRGGRGGASRLQRDLTVPCNEGFHHPLYRSGKLPHLHRTISDKRMRLHVLLARLAARHDGLAVVQVLVAHHRHVLVVGTAALRVGRCLVNIEVHQQVTNRLAPIRGDALAVDCDEDALLVVLGNVHNWVRCTRQRLKNAEARSHVSLAPLLLLRGVEL